MTKRILYFFPANPLKKNTGSITRALELLYYFKSRSFHVDYVYSRDRWGGHISEADKDELKASGLVHNVFKIAKKPDKGNPFTYLFMYKIPSLLGNVSRFFQKKSIPNYATTYTQVLFNAILRNNNYDYIIISYAFWADLIKENALIKEAKTIIDTHDLLMAQHQQDKRFNRGKAFDGEMSKLNLFDEIWAISADEQYIFSQFCIPKVKLIPFTVANSIQNSMPYDEKEVDILYVGGNNFHNIAAIRWFFEHVYPVLDKDYKILIIGAISNHIPSFDNVTKISFAEDLSEYYNNARIAICPMLTGTGVKIKVVEALSYGLPVVCSLRGVDGLLNKIQNGCMVSHSGSEFAQNIKALLDDKDLYSTYQGEAFRYIQSAHSREETYRALDASFNA